ncbi:MAG: hypothetical protein U0694_06670 [Anaerolineae bacterium]
MVVLQIEHAVISFDDWKQAFDSDPAGRQKSGVQRYRVLRHLENPNHVVIELEFASRQQAETLLTNLRNNVWPRMQGSITDGPHARIVELVETVEY